MRYRSVTDYDALNDCDPDQNGGITIERDGIELHVGICTVARAVLDGNRTFLRLLSYAVDPMHELKWEDAESIEAALTVALDAIRKKRAAAE